MIEVCDRSIQITEGLYTSLGRSALSARGMSLVDYAQEYPQDAYIDVIDFALGSRIDIKKVTGDGRNLEYDSVLMGIKKSEIVELLLSSVVDRAVDLSVGVEFGKPNLWPRVKDFLKHGKPRRDMAEFEPPEREGIVMEEPLIIISADFTTFETDVMESRIEAIKNTSDF